MAEHCGYDSGHCWYYKLGGTPLTPKQIRDECTTPIMSYDVEKALKRNEPYRSQEINRIREATIEGLRRDLHCYREVVRDLRRWQNYAGPWPWLEVMYREPTVAVSLKHNHICYGFRVLLHLDSLQTETQLDLF